MVTAWPERPRILVSFAYQKTLEHAVQRDNIDLLVDSGAFTAHTLGQAIDLRDYVDFVNAHHKRITTAVALDVIGDWRASARNLDRMMERVTGDVTVLPVWHSGSPEEELRRLCREYGYVGVGGVTGLGSTPKRFMQHMIRAHRIARDEGALLHGLGVTGKTGAVRLPWHTVDSSSWLSGARYGKVILYDGETLRVVSLSEKLSAQQRLLIRRFGMDPAQAQRAGFGMSKSGGEYKAESRWLVEAAARSFMALEGRMRTKNKTDARLYLATNVNEYIDVAISAHTMGSPW